MSHGLRGTYQAGCRCLPCRSANAAHQARWRQIRRTKAPLGALISPTEARRLVDTFQREAWNRRRLAQDSHVGLRTLERLTSAQRIRLKTLLKLRRAYRIFITESSIHVRSEQAETSRPARPADSP